MTHDATGVLSWRFARRTVAALALAAAAGSFLAQGSEAAAARSGPRDGRRGIDVVTVQGYFDRANADLVEDAIASANERRSTLLILQVDSSGAIDTGVDDILRAIDRSRVPVVVWIGPSGADGKGAATLLLGAAHRAYVAPGSTTGPAFPLRLDDPATPTRAAISDRLAELAAERGRDPQGARRLTTSSFDAEEAARLGAVDGVRPTLGELIVRLDGKTVQTAAGPVKLDTARVIGTGLDRRRQPNQEVRFGRLGLGAQVVHRLNSPSIAYFLLMAGLALIVFEFYTAAIGLAGFVGAVCVVGAFAGFAHLPVHWWALGLLFLATFGYAIDVQAGGLGVWTGIATVALLTGSWWLYGGSSELRPAWWVLLVVCGGTILFMLGGMTAMIRARFSTPTIGREGMVGEVGVAEVPVDPDGVVLIRGARWRARTNRATPVEAGAEVRVVSVEGLVLEVEPPEGGARDYRDRARRQRPE
jgi:membrane-bound serine protease (ClpP class)